MRKSYNSIDYEWLTKPTGDPFADAGGYVIKYLSEKKPEMDILELIVYIAKIYVDRWEAGLHMFFLNSTITQNRFKTAEIKKGKTKEYFTDLLTGKIESTKGICRIIGQETNLYKAGRDNSFLTGSGGFLNFHHGLDAGVMLSQEAIIRFFFVPFGCEIIYDKIAIIGSNIPKIVECYVNKVVQQNEFNTIFKFSARSKYSNVANSLFAFIDDLIINSNDIIEEEKDVSLTLFHFTNIGTAPAIDIHKIPSKVFHFYRFTLSPLFKIEWKTFVKANYIKYVGHKANYDQNSNSYVEHTKELSGIEKDMFEKLQNNMSLNFDLCQFGNKAEGPKEFILLDAGDFDNWKKGKVFKKWKEDNSNDAVQLHKQTKKFKGNTALKYHENYFSYKWRNVIYDKLLHDNSIIPNILKWSEYNKFSFKIVRFYQQIIKNMNTKTLDLIEKISNYVIENEADIKSNISKLRANDNPSLRSFLIRLIEKNYKGGNTEPLVTLREYVEYLFPVGTNWKEIRDLMLICVYQKLHENNIDNLDLENGEDQSVNMNDENEFEY